MKFRREIPPASGLQMMSTAQPLLCSAWSKNPEAWARPGGGWRRIYVWSEEVGMLILQSDPREEHCVLLFGLNARAFNAGRTNDAVDAVVPGTPFIEQGKEDVDHEPVGTSDGFLPRQSQPVLGQVQFCAAFRVRRFEGRMVETSNAAALTTRLIAGRRCILGRLEHAKAMVSSVRA